ncbi:uncharacterized protein LOC110452787 [Mizuhopecten yessoensis]|uniref:Uncharacterized protein n=1 Tax=Mizuhopecten yessoensis TaxID=6573 RepID=A0A210QIS1_MIZYE|nr:uncharacterized protein LOC110452787 [Mizuhopecten yessoensis]OWF48688.1 hypothetical protein KP79_PYT04668 [Mizuhopecten yessoensis]
MERRTGGWILLLLVICFTYSQARLCFICGYNAPTDGKVGINCVNDTSKASVHTNCSNDRVCTFDVQFLKSSLELVSVTRNCLPSSAPRSNTCLDDWTHRQCTFSCNTDLCNNLTAQELNNRYGDRGANSAHSSVEIISLVSSSLVVCAVWIVKTRISL